MRAFFVLGLLAVAACGAKSAPAPAAPAAPAPAPAPAPAAENLSLADVGLDADRLDRAADPCNDFYRFACGGWLDKTELPPDDSYFGTFVELERRNEQILHKILDDAASNPGSDPVTAKLGAFYGGCMDEAALEKAGLAALEPTFALTRKVKDPASLMAAVAELHEIGVGVLFAMGSGQDKKNATRVITLVLQSGLGLPDRDYYLSDDAKMKGLREAYQAHLERLLVLLGRKPAAAKKGAAAVMAIETALARTHKTRVELRDEEGTYNLVDRAGLAKLAPGLPWDAYLAALGIPKADAFNLYSPKAIEALPAIARGHKPAAWRDYLDVHVVSDWEDSLPKRFQDEDFAFNKLLKGVKEQRARWRRCVSSTTSSLPDLVGQPFVKVAFSGASKEAAETMVRQLVAAFDANLDHVVWIDQATRAKAREKLRKLDLMIGYPEKWKTYDFEVDRAHFTESALRSVRFANALDLAKIGKPVDRRDWVLPASIVNAFYQDTLNQMVFPAGILQRPFYDVRASVPVNLGGMGMIVGHELTHGFDDNGALFDGDGNLSGWWPEKVTKAFKERTQCTAQYYSEFEVLPGLKENGALTNGENIADMGGVKLAFQAYRELAKSAPRHVVAEGFDEDQQFFLALGQAWCEKESEEFIRYVTAVDVHSLPRQRILGVLSGLPEFSAAFSCKEGAPMHPAKTCEVW